MVQDWYGAIQPEWRLFEPEFPNPPIFRFVEWRNIFPWSRDSKSQSQNPDPDRDGNPCPASFRLETGQLDFVLVAVVVAAAKNDTIKLFQQITRKSHNFGHFNIMHLSLEKNVHLV